MKIWTPSSSKTAATPRRPAPPCPCLSTPSRQVTAAALAVTAAARAAVSYSPLAPPAVLRGGVSGGAAARSIKDVTYSNHPTVLSHLTMPGTLARSSS
ncbi:hypothetical protein, partial [Ottowia massiliensis]|uniref:hypothetical protein n=1 Tax=Ottowia massiliensis TaxID=2045302 RepID=UPI001E450FC7